MHFESHEDAVAAMAKEGSQLRKYRAGGLTTPGIRFSAQLAQLVSCCQHPVRKSGLDPDYTGFISQIVPQSAVPSNYS